MYCTQECIILTYGDMDHISRSSWSCDSVIVCSIIERAKRAHSLFMSIEIAIYYVRVVRVSCVPFIPYTQEAQLKIILKYARVSTSMPTVKVYSILEISGNFNVRGSLHFYS